MRDSVASLIATANAAKENRELSEAKEMAKFKDDFVEQIVGLLKSDSLAINGKTCQLCFYLSFNENAIMVCTRRPIETKEHDDVWLNVNHEKLGETEICIPIPKTVKHKYVFSSEKLHFFNMLTDLITDELPVKEHHTLFIHLVGHTVVDHLLGVFNINFAKAEA